MSREWRRLAVVSGHSKGGELEWGGGRGGEGGGDQCPGIHWQYMQSQIGGKKHRCRLQVWLKMTGQGLGNGEETWLQRKRDGRR